MLETLTKFPPVRRRSFVATAVTATASALVGCTSRQGQSSSASSATSGNASEQHSSDSDAGVELELRAAPESVALVDGSQTNVWRFSADVLQGPKSAVQEHQGGYLGPTLRFKQGQRVRVHLDNGLDEETIVHWHGLHVAEPNDGHPSYVVPPGSGYDYDFQIANRAGTYWYHPHPHHRTGPQVYQGLAGLLLVTDDDEQRLGLPDGDRELLMVLQDRTLDHDGQFLYEPDSMLGMLGERIFINGQVPRTWEVAKGPHRLRLLNGSNSRIYDLRWSDGSPMVVIGTDGGLLEAPRERPHIVLAPGQRLEIWADFGTRPGPDVWLESQAFDGSGPSMDGAGGMVGGGMMGGDMAGQGMGHRMRVGAEIRVPDGTPLRLQHFVLTGKGSPGRAPEQLAPAPAPTPAQRKGPVANKTFSLEMQHMHWLINGRPWETRGVAEDERVKLGTVENWEFVNSQGKEAMAHPMHLHGPQFRIVERHSGPGAGTLREGIFDEGLRDTFLVLPGDRVRIQPRFEDHTGLYLYHCHNLEHEDMGMMRNFSIEA